jgi:UDP-3-O-[3-hydroxymyristoyl] glucosamine N-acyltransferase
MLLGQNTRCSFAVRASSSTSISMDIPACFAAFGTNEWSVKPGMVFTSRNHGPRSSAMKSTRASAVLVNESWKGETSATLIRVKSADAAFAQVATWLARPAITYAPGIHPTAVISDGAILGRSVHVGPHCVIESGVKVGDRSVLVAGCYLGRDCVVGEECLFYPHVTIREYTQVGNRVILHNGAVIGSDGFGYVREAVGTIHW